MNVTTAVIYAAGFGSRMLPVTSAFQKELLPILDRPSIDYIVADCLAAGATRIIFTVQPGNQSLRNYYLGNAALERGLARLGKTASIEQLQAIQQRATYEFVEQQESDGYGTAVPLKAAKELLKDEEAFILCYGDAILWRTDDGSDVADMVATFKQQGGGGALLAKAIPSADVSRYGILSLHTADGHEFLDGIVEKPQPKDAPSNLINLGFYVLTQGIWPHLDGVKQQANQEYYLTDAVEAHTKANPFVVQRTSGQFLDTGSVEKWLETNLIVASSQPGLKSALSKTVRDLF